MSEPSPLTSPGPEEALPEKRVTPLRLFLRRLRRSRIALVGGVALALLYLVAVFGGFFQTYDHLNLENLRRQRRNLFHPPTRIHFIDAEGGFHWRPFIYRYEIVDRERRQYAPDTSARHSLRFFAEGDSYRLWGFIPTNRHLLSVEGDAPLYLMGADHEGKDVWSRLVEGGQVSLSVGLIGIVITMSLGLLVGGIAGYFGGWIDTALMRLVELLMSIPALYLLLAMQAALPDDISSAERYMLIVAILGFVYWAGTARVIRGMVLSLREEEYILASRALGASHLRLIVKHLLPNTFTYVIVAATIAVPAYILGEVVLSFLGVGIQKPATSWGLMLKEAQDPDLLLRHTWLVIPGVAIFVTVLAFNFLGDGLRDALDPKSKR
jgi:peptide/nickel transport system permease protein